MSISTHASSSNLAAGKTRELRIERNSGSSGGTAGSASPSELDGLLRLFDQATGAPPLPQSAGAGADPVLGQPPGLISSASGAPTSGGAQVRESDEAAPGTAAKTRNEDFNEAAAVLGRYEDRLDKKMSIEDFKRMSEDQSLPEDLRAAIKTISNDPQMLDKLDRAADEEGKSDGSVGVKDVRALQDGLAPAQEEKFREAVMVLGRHEDRLDGKSIEDFKRMSEDESLPQDLRAAIKTVSSDPAMLDKLDRAADKDLKTDGTIGKKDVRALQQKLEQRAFTDQRSASYLDNYKPSDSGRDAPAREMTANDALRELFRYGDSLGEYVGLGDLKRIADGSADAGKAPPALMAAAKYFVNNPEEWERAAGGKVAQRERLMNRATDNVQLRPEEAQAIKVMNDNKDIFFKKKNLTPERAKEIAEDSSNSEEVRRAAAILAQPESMLFGMVENAKHGAGGNFFNKANDKKLSKGDLEAFLRKNNLQPSLDDQNAVQNAGSNAATGQDVQAQADMDVGRQSQPDPKKQKGGEVFKVLDVLLKVLPFITGFLGPVGAVVGAVARAATAAGRIAGQIANQVGKVVAREVADVAKDTVKDTATDTVATEINNRMQQQQAHVPKP